MVADTPSENAAHRPGEVLGERIRARRLNLGWSLSDLAARAGVSRAMLSKVERAESSPTITVLQKVAAALGVSAASLIGVEHDRPVVILRGTDAATFRDGATGYERQIFPAVEGSPVELIRGQLVGRGTSGDLSIQPVGSRKYVVVESGEVVLQVADERYPLEEGDVCLFPADVAHRFDNPGTQPCRLLMIKLPIASRP
jgi:transcriptional regulator with XRE-family HTH domain